MRPNRIIRLAVAALLVASGLVAGSVSGQAAVAPAECSKVGTDGPDILVGGRGPNHICGLGGSDQINGGRGADRLDGGAGADVIRGGLGLDTCVDDAADTFTSCEQMVPSTSAPVVVGYFASWGVYGRDYHVTEIPADRLTHINYAFANISPQGEVVLGDPYADIDKFYPGDTWDAGALRGSFHQLQLLKAQYPNLRTFISVGGWTWSGRFSDAALTQTSRERFATSAVAFVRTYDFDGVDIDWEYPVAGGLDANTRRPEDGHNYTLLLQEIRRQLDIAEGQDGQEYLLTIAAPAGEWVAQYLERSQIAATVDWINLMTYDLHGPWDGVTGHHGQLTDTSGQGLSATDTIQHYVAAGAPASKLVLGAPFYGRSWSGVSAGPAGDGLGRSSTGEGPGTWEGGMLDYWDLESHFINKNGFTRYWDAVAQAPYVYNPSSKIWVSYEDAQSATARGALARTSGLRGAMFWELSGDTATHTLLDALRAGLNL